MAALGLLTVTQANPAQAVTSLQSFSLTDTFTNFPAESSTTAQKAFVVPQFTVQPFDINLGTLTSTTVVWATTASFSGTPGSALSSGSVSLNVGGSVYVNTTSYGGNGGGTCNGGVAPFSVNLASVGVTTQFLSSNAGYTYNSNILAAFIGPSPYTIQWLNIGGLNNSPNILSYTNIASGTASFTATASVTYDYVANVPGPLPLLGTGAAWNWSRRCAQRQA